MTNKPPLDELYKSGVKEKLYKNFPEVKLVTIHTTNLKTGKSWTQRRVLPVNNQAAFDVCIRDWYKSSASGIELPYIVDTEVDLGDVKMHQKKEIIMDAELIELGEEDAK